MLLLAAKLGGAAVLLVAALLLGLLPFKLMGWLQRREEAGGRRWVQQLALSCIQCFGAGILMATVFTHMLPEVRESLVALRPGDAFPLAEVLLCAGMFAIYTIEELVEEGLKRGGKTAWTHSHGCHPEAPLFERRTSGYGTLDGDVKGANGRAAGANGSTDGEAVIHDHQGHAHMPHADGNLGSFRVFVVAVALSVHSVFEGMAIGLESQSSTDVWLLVAAIACHKSIIAFCLGEQLAASGQRMRTALVTLAVFVLASPVGTCAGIIIITSSSGEGTSELMAASVLQALAAGSILYVVFFEIIQGEREKPGSGLAKLVAVLVGFGFMLTVTTFIREPEEDGPAGGDTMLAGVTPAA